MKAYWGLLLVSTAALAYGYEDSDWDGVDDRYDRCPQTPLSDLVNADGCTIFNIDSSLHYTITSGFGYTNVNYASQDPVDTISLSLDVSFYYHDWEFQSNLAYFHSDAISQNSGMDDTVLSLLYRSALSEPLSITTGIGLILPTYQSGYGNEALDYRAMIDLRYRFFQDWHGLFGYESTWINDSDVETISYQDTEAYYAGVSYLSNNGSEWTTRYYQTDAIYRDVAPIKSVSLGYYRETSSHSFIDITYGMGLSDSASDQSVMFRIGYFY